MHLVTEGAIHDYQTECTDAGSAAFRAGRSGIARAQSYPAKPVRFVVPFPAGGSTDVAARLIAEYLSRAFGQQVYVENKSGANGTIGIEDAAKSAPDGYTILVTTDAVASNPHVYHTNIDPSKDLLPIIQLSRQPIVLAAHPSLGVNSLAELIALAKQQPGLPYATGSGVGSAQHMAVQWFAQIAGITFEQVPYRGGGQAINDLTRRPRQAWVARIDAADAALQGRHVAPAGADHQAARRALPDVPTYQEAGIQGLVLDQWLGVFAPPRTPPDIIARLNAEIDKAIADPSVRKSLLDSAQEPIGGISRSIRQLVREDYAKFGRLVKDLNIKAE